MWRSIILTTRILPFMISPVTIGIGLTNCCMQGEKPQGTMWESLCADVEINYNGNQDPFTQVDQCQNQVGRPLMLR